MALAANRKQGALQVQYNSVTMRDDKKFYFGDDWDVSLEYDANGTGCLSIDGGDTLVEDGHYLYFGNGKDGSIRESESTVYTAGAWDFTGATTLTTPIPTATADTGIKTETITVSAASMIDGGTTTASVSSASNVFEVGDFVLGYAAQVTAGFTGGGNTSVTVEVGDGTDTDRFGPATDASCHTAAEIGGLSQGIPVIDAAKPLHVTLTCDSDFSSIIASDVGLMNVKVFYINAF